MMEATYDYATSPTATVNNYSEPEEDLYTSPYGLVVFKLTWLFHYVSDLSVVYLLYYIYLFKVYHCLHR